MTDLVLERFWEKVEVDKISKCWNWTGKKVRGYGSFNIKGKDILAHRFAYEVNKGKIPNRLSLDHLCRNIKCVNPDHLEAVTMKVNVHRGIGPTSLNAKKTHCNKGHPLSGDNLKMEYGFRRCRQCKKDYVNNKKLVK